MANQVQESLKNSREGPRCSLEEDPLWVGHKQDRDQEFILLLPQAAVMELASIRFCHPQCSDLVFHVMPDV